MLMLCSMLVMAMCSALPAAPGTNVRAYATLWSQQIARWELDPASHPGALAAWLGDVRDAGLDTFMFSVSWSEFEPSEGVWAL